MRERIVVLKDIIFANGNLAELEKEISSFPWDSEKELVLLRRKDLTRILEKTVSGKMALKDLVTWANLIECRDDIGFENENNQDLIFRLANPEINGDITIKELENIVRQI